jgi:hypothetical protein
MTVLGIDLNDAALTGYAAETQVFAEPGYALAPDGELLFGWDAWHAARRYPRRMQNRYWAELADEPLPTPMAGAHTAADLVHGHLEALWRRAPDDCRGVSFAVPAYWNPAQLGLLLGIAQELSIPVLGFVDAAVASARREYPCRELVSLEASLHGMAFTRIEQSGRAALGTRELLPGLGVELLERSCVQFFAAGFLQAARFDPMHDAATEQYLYDELDGWLGSLSRESSLRATVSYQGNEFAAEFRRDDLEARLAERCQPLLQRARSLLPADGATALLLPAGLDRFPGFVEGLRALPGVEVFTLEPGAAACAATRRSVTSAAAEGLRLLTALPWDQAPAPAPAELRDAVAIEQPTHLLAGSRAFRLTPAEPFAIGTELASGVYGLTVDGGVAGVSRQHCSIHVDGGRLVLTDHSRFGTQLNGHRIDGSAVLQVGDVVAVGQPPREFRLVAEVGPDGA